MVEPSVVLHFTMKGWGGSCDPAHFTSAVQIHSTAAICRRLKQLFNTQKVFSATHNTWYMPGYSTLLHNLCIIWCIVLIGSITIFVCLNGWLCHNFNCQLSSQKLAICDQPDLHRKEAWILLDINIQSCFSTFRFWLKWITDD